MRPASLNKRDPLVGVEGLGRQVRGKILVAELVLRPEHLPVKLETSSLSRIVHVLSVPAAYARIARHREEPIVDEDAQFGVGVPLRYPVGFKDSSVGL